MSTLILTLLFACVAAVDARKVPAVTAPKPEVEAPPPPPSQETPPRPSWQAGWTYAEPILRKPEVVWGVTLGGPILAPLLADESQVYAVADGRVSAYTHDGRRAWEARIDGVEGAALAGETVVAGGGDGRVHFLDRATGKARSTTERGGPLVGPPVAIDGGWAWVTEEGVVATNAGWLHATGKHPVGRAAADESTLYLANTDGTLLAVGPKGVEWQVVLPGLPAAGPALDEDNVYVSIVAADGEPGGVVAYGRWGPLLSKERWRFRSDFQPLAAVGADIHNVYVPDKDGYVYALDADDGRKLWASEGYAEFTTQPLVTTGSVYVGNSDGNIARLDTYDGGRVWAVDLGAPVSGEPVIVGTRLFVGLANGRLIALQ